MNKIMQTRVLKTLIFLFTFMFVINFVSSGQSDSWVVNHAERTQPAPKLVGIVCAFFAVGCLVGFVAIGIWLKKRKFERTNQYGTEEFSSTKSYMGSEVSEGFANLAARILFAGMLFFFLAALIKCN